MQAWDSCGVRGAQGWRSLEISGGRSKGIQLSFRKQKKKNHTLETFSSRFRDYQTRINVAPLQKINLFTFILFRWKSKFLLGSWPPPIPPPPSRDLHLWWGQGTLIGNDTPLVLVAPWIYFIAMFSVASGITLQISYNRPQFSSNEQFYTWRSYDAAASWCSWWLTDERSDAWKFRS